jgi:WD40 repeat protein
VNGRFASVPVASFPDGKSILFVARGIAQVWDISTGLVADAPAFHPEGKIRAVALSPDGRSILISGPGQAARLWAVARCD